MLIASDYWPQAIFGGLLWGDLPMRFVYMDEAGTADTEPVTVVVGLIVDADKQTMHAEAATQEVLGAVPTKFREGFIFHATEVWGSPKYRDDWTMTDRLGLLHRMMALPRRLQIPISLGIVRRTAARPQYLPPSLSLAQCHHVDAFRFCIAKADKYIRDHADLREVATVVAEDVPEMRQFLRHIPRLLREQPIVLPPGSLLPTAAEQSVGYSTQESELRVSRVRNSIHFVEKGDDIITYLADACAFGFRRCFAEQDFGAEFVRSILGSDLRLDDWTGPASADTFRWHP